ncbi:Alpha/Beta hydrolase protein [Ostreococcus tauri]|uniref:Alpha/Beta hydrolase protein n=1 Tax=Ostreococcus tauri TaxID=70448 RepID=A0A1Y5IGU8_OSTTA|nr:Alpha/Beta hydrolase protein [Ostreococcus tauri]
MLRPCAPVPNGAVKETIVCVPPSGCGVGAFSGAFAEAMAATGREVVAVDVPGRPGSSDRELWRHGVVALGREIADALHAYQSRVILYGHSVGAWMAFEAAAARPSVVSRLVVSGARAPRLGHWLNDPDELTPRLSTIDDDDTFWCAFERRYGASRELRHHRTAMVDSLRNDFEMVENYAGSETKLSIPLTAIGIRNDDRTTTETIEQWSSHADSFSSMYYGDVNEPHAHRVLLDQPSDFATFLARDVLDAS